MSIFSDTNRQFSCLMAVGPHEGAVLIAFLSNLWTHALISLDKLLVYYVGIVSHKAAAHAKRKHKNH